jgi:hypothetical protein
MTWQSANFQADKLLSVILSRVAALAESHVKPAFIPLSIYETDHDLAVLRPEDQGQWTAAFHAEVMRALARKIRKATGIKVVLKTIDAAGYLRWLAENNLKNEAANRAAFISLPPQ